MAMIYPVIMCGGAGTRLWPASRPSRPKQFIPLAGNRSLFQDAVERALPLMEQGGELIVVGGKQHRLEILAQLDEVGAKATIFLEPEGRDSAAAMAVAALWTAQQHPRAVNLFVASDHHIPDHGAFHAAVQEAAAAADTGRIVTLGVVPTEPSSAYGYIAPSGAGLTDVAAFVEKPDALTAERHIHNGYLWNSGNFIVRADVLIEELSQQAPAVLIAARDALEHAEFNGRFRLLGSQFLNAPTISIDYAVMEKTGRASVLPVRFSWSDLGAWDAVQASGEGSVGLHVLEDSEGCLVRSSDGVMVAVIGLRDVGVIVERDAVLVTDLKRSQDVRKIVERIGKLSPSHLDFPALTPELLKSGAERLATWLRQSALPVWCTLGQGTSGAFEALLSTSGRRIATSPVLQVQAAQLEAYALAGRQDWPGPWRAVVEKGLPHLPLDSDQSELGDHSGFPVALAAIFAATGDPSVKRDATTLRDRLIGDQTSPPDQAKSLILLEGALAWAGISTDPGWRRTADQIVSLMQAASDIDHPASPGDLFYRAWLLARYSRLTSDTASLVNARKLFTAGLQGIDLNRGVAVESVSDQGLIQRGRARLWSQTQWLKASLILASMADDAPCAASLEQAGCALRAVWLFLTPQGLWRDAMLESGDFIDEPSPALSFRSIMTAHIQLRETLGALAHDGDNALRLS
ncbi:sugar phosphate nucleotidyltransferase [Brevundimonas sp. TWP1-2-1b1]|uniref:sugar phosphate nucleotidyltransferase n=1 Tax=unclassified Brevundimonas TaxID=2622653 RepID=UPI003CFB14A5